MAKILAFDVAGEATGWSYAEGRTLKAYGKHISNIRKPKGERLYAFYVYIGSLLEKYTPDIILVERPYIGRNSGVLTNLSKFIAMIDLQAYSVLKIEIKPEWYIHSRAVKRIMDLKKLKGNNHTTRDKYNHNKREMVRKVNKQFGLKLKFNANVSKRYNDDDIADSIGLLVTWWKMQGDKTEN